MNRRKVRQLILKVTRRTINPIRLLLVPLLLVIAAAMLVCLKVYIVTRPPRRSVLHSKAINNIDLFLKQYPLHLYPILCKCLELAHLQDELPVILARREKLVEIAIGEGSFSSLIFPSDAGVVGLEINPHYLRKTRQLKHVKEAIVCDCLEPPLCKGSFDVLVANNFLHHVTAKAKLLGEWSRLSEKAVFNENTIFWASGWAKPYILAKLGLTRIAARIASRIEREHWQSLLERRQLDTIVSQNYQIARSVSYLSEVTFFLCTLFSLLMICTGPPTPAVLKRLFLGALRPLALPITKRLAQFLIQFDEFQDRSKDTFVSYTGISRNFQRSKRENYLICPRCKSGLDLASKCRACGSEYPRVDGMLFLLPAELDHIRLNYSPLISEKLPAELL